MKKPLIILFIALAILVGVQDFYTKKHRLQTPSPRPYVVLISANGFRWDYEQKADTPTLDSITKYGVKALGLQPCFPSLSLPNQYSIATGLQPSNHGIIADDFYSSKAKRYFSKSDQTSLDRGEFYKGEPIWVTAEAQNIKTGACNWVGSGAKIKGYKPSYINASNNKTAHKQEVDTIINWLQLPYKNRPKLIVWNINEVNQAGQTFGTESDEVILSISAIDSLLGSILEQTNTLSIKDSINFIIVSDHGMTDVSSQKTVQLNTVLNHQWTDTILGDDAFLLVYPKKRYADSIINTISNIEGVTAWRKDDIPERFNYKQNSRVSDIIIVADSGWRIKSNSSNTLVNRGICGYNNTQKNINGIFYAIGPNFKTAYSTELLYNIDIYNLIANILEIKPAPNDGKAERISHVIGH